MQMMKKALMLSLMGVFSAQPLYAVEAPNVTAGNVKDERFKARLKRLDINADGKVTRDEFLKDQEARFKRMDANGDGILDGKDPEARRAKRNAKAAAESAATASAKPAAPAAPR